jgi:hypothetical protein
VGRCFEGGNGHLARIKMIRKYLGVKTTNFLGISLNLIALLSQSLSQFAITSLSDLNERL